MSGSIVATGVTVRRADDPTAWLEAAATNHGRLAARQLAQRLETGELVLVEAQSFIEFTDGEREHRFGGPTFGQREIEIGPDPTKRLMEIVEEHREHAYGLVAEVRIHEVRATAWEAYAAPSRVELDPELAELLYSRRS